MVLVICPECANSISDKAEACPQCGYPIGEKRAIRERDHLNKVKGRKNRGRKVRGWLILACVISVFLAYKLPLLPLLIGSFFVLSCIFQCFESTKPISFKFLKLEQGRPILNFFQMFSFLFTGVLLLVLGFICIHIKTEDQERERIEAIANQRIKSLSKEILIAWKAGDLDLVDNKIKIAYQVKNVTDLTPVKKLQVRIGNWKVKKIEPEIKKLLEEMNLKGAEEQINKAFKIPFANEISEIRKFQKFIYLATDIEVVERELLRFSESEYIAFKAKGILPRRLISGISKIDKKIITLTKNVLPKVSDVIEEKIRIKEEKRIEVERKKKEEERLQKEKKKADEARLSIENRKRRITRQFSPWDGSHYSLERYIKTIMNDPDSYKHDKTTFTDMGNYLIVNTSFRGKNAFGGVVRNTISAKVDLNGRVLEILSQ